MVVRDASDIAARWDEFIRGRPDFVKLFLRAVPTPPAAPPHRVCRGDSPSIVLPARASYLLHR